MHQKCAALICDCMRKVQLGVCECLENVRFEAEEMCLQLTCRIGQQAEGEEDSRETLGTHWILSGVCLGIIVKMCQDDSPGLIRLARYLPGESPPR